MNCTNLEWDIHSNNQIHNDHSKIKIVNGAIRTQIRTNYHLPLVNPKIFPMELGGHSEPVPNGYREGHPTLCQDVIHSNERESSNQNFFF